MKPHPFLISACALVLLAPVLASAQDAKKYDLKLNRPDKVGNKFHDEMKGTLEKSQKITQGKNTKEEARDMKVELSGEEEILEVSDKGKAKKLSFKVEKFLLRVGEEPEEEAFKPGTVITATGGEGQTDKFEVDGKEVTGGAAEALNELLSLNGNKKKQVDEDAVFGTGEPRAAGTEWEVNAKALIESMPEEMPMSIKEEGVQGKVKFPAVKTVDGIECAQIQINIGIKPDSVQKMPKGFKLEKVSIKISGERALPLDATIPVPMEKMSQQMEFSGTIPDPQGGDSIKISVFQRTIKERVCKAVK